MMLSFRSLLGVLLGTLLLGFAAPAAQASDFGVTHFQTGFSSSQAGATADYTLKFGVTQQDPNDPNSPPTGVIRDQVIDMPPGFIADPTAVDACSMSRITYLAPERCPVTSVVGKASVRLFNSVGGAVTPTYLVRVYRLKPYPGEAAAFGFAPLLAYTVRLSVTVDPGNGYRVRVSSHNQQSGAALVDAEVTMWGVPAEHQGPGPLNELAYFESFGGPLPASVRRKRFASVPTRCDQPAVTSMLLASWQDRVFLDPVMSSAGTPAGCGDLVFSPALAVTPTVTQAAVPSGYRVVLGLGQSTDPARPRTPNLKDATVTLPEGVTISPSAANGLQACTDAQLGIDSAGKASCPAASKIGDVRIDSPVLDEPVTGTVFTGEQLSDDPESGRMFRIFLVAAASGVNIKLRGQIAVDPRTGQITARFLDNPDLPFEKMTLTFKDGSRAPLTTPPVCGEHATRSTFTSWAGQSVDVTSPMTVDQGCAGLGWFGPYFSAGTVNPVAGASSPFALRVNKPDGQSDLNGIAMVLPEGLLGSLKGNIGTRIGTARVAAGSGPSPFWLSGPVVLEGPYGDAPFSLRVTVPAIAGPFNLGDVTVRQKIYIDPHDAHVTVVSDPLPTIVKGVPVNLQSLQVDIDKAGFMKNPTSCAVKSIGATLAAPTGQSAAVASRFQVGDCAGLPLRPKLKMELIGKKETKRGKHPTLSATLTQQPGESGLKKVKVRLPLSLALDPDNAQALCKPEQAAAKACPAGSIVGKATAVTPLLDQPLTGDVFFVEGTRKSKTGRIVKTLPKLWVALRGQVALDVWADSATVDGKYLVTTFGFVPDAPISSFKIDIQGGAHGILAVTGEQGASLCKQANVTRMDYDGQNGKQVTSQVRMGTPCTFQVAAKSLTNTHARVTVGGLAAGKLSISGKGIHKASRTIKHSDVATIKPRLTRAGMRAAKQGTGLRMRVSFNPKGKGKTKAVKTTVKRAKKAATR